MAERCREPDSHRSVPPLGGAERDLGSGDPDGAHIWMHSQDGIQEYGDGAVVRVTGMARTPLRSRLVAISWVVSPNDANTARAFSRRSRR